MKSPITLIAGGLIGLVFALNLIEASPLKFIVAGLFIAIQYTGVYLIVANWIRNKQQSKLIMPLMAVFIIVGLLTVYLLFLRPTP